MTSLQLRGSTAGQLRGITQLQLSTLLPPRPCHLGACSRSKDRQVVSTAAHQLTHAELAGRPAALLSAIAAETTGGAGASCSGRSNDQRMPMRPSFYERVKAGMAQHGPSFFFTYITLSNLASCIMLATGMMLFVRTTGHSPLGSGQWPSFVAFYAGVWSLNQTCRSARFAAAAMLAPAVDRPITWLAERLQWDKPRAVLLLFMLEAPMLLAGLAAVLAACCGGIGRMFM